MKIHLLILLVACGTAFIAGSIVGELQIPANKDLVAFFDETDTTVGVATTVGHGLYNALRKCADAKGIPSVNGWGKLTCFANEQTYHYDDFEWVGVAKLNL